MTESEEGFLSKLNYIVELKDKKIAQLEADLKIVDDKEFSLYDKQRIAFQEEIKGLRESLKMRDEEVEGLHRILDVKPPSYIFVPVDLLKRISEYAELAYKQNIRKGWHPDASFMREVSRDISELFKIRKGFR